MAAFIESGRAALVLLVASVGALASAYTAEYAFGLAPCVLCLYQRVPYALVVALAGVALFVRDERWRRAVLALAGLALFVGAGIALYHVGVEQHWWKGTAACGGALPDALTVAQLRAQLSGPPPVPCDQVPWSLFGVSMAGYNVVLFLALGALAVAAALKGKAAA